MSSSPKDFAGRTLRKGQLVAYPSKPGTQLYVQWREVTRIDEDGRVWVRVPEKKLSKGCIGRDSLLHYPSNLVIVYEPEDIPHDF